MEACFHHRINYKNVTLIFHLPILTFLATVGLYLTNDFISCNSDLNSDFIPYNYYFISHNQLYLIIMTLYLTLITLYLIIMTLYLTIITLYLIIDFIS